MLNNKLPTDFFLNDQGQSFVLENGLAVMINDKQKNQIIKSRKAQQQQQQQQQQPQQQQQQQQQQQITSKLSLPDNMQHTFTKLFSFSLIALGSAQMTIALLSEKNILAWIFNVNENSTASGVLLSFMSVLLIIKGAVGLSKKLAAFESYFWVNLLDILIVGLIAITNVTPEKGGNTLLAQAQHAISVQQPSAKDNKISIVSDRSPSLKNDQKQGQAWLGNLKADASQQYGINSTTSSLGSFSKTQTRLDQDGYNWCREKYNNGTLGKKGHLNCATGYIWNSNSI